MIPKMSNECFRAFISNISLFDLKNPQIHKVAEVFEKDFEQKAKQKQLLKTTASIYKS